MPTSSVAPTQNGIALDDFNAGLRASPAWQQFVQAAGYKLDGSPIKLTSHQRIALRAKLAQAGITLPPGVEIDPAGNVNQDQGWSRYKKPVLTGLAIAGATLATMGAAGFGPLAGVMGHGAAAAAAGSGAGGTAATGSAALTAIPGAANVSALSDLAALGIGGSTAAPAAAGSVVAPTVATVARRSTGNIGRNYGDLLRYGLPVAGGLIGQRMASNADRDAAEMELAATREALADAREQRDYDRARGDEQRGYDRGQYANYLARLEPFRAYQAPAMSRLEALLASARRG